ncbi:MAG: hypothetical protein QM489_04935 [Candidatus Izemoplasma sp.]
MYYHGSKTPGIKSIKPNQSMHDQEYTYLTTNEVVALIYTVNAIEVFYENNNITKPGSFQPWYSYGFNKDLLPIIDEYYPNSTHDTYSNRSGSIYLCQEPSEYTNETNIHCAITTTKEVVVIKEIFIPDVYKKLLEYEKQGLLKIRKYEDTSEEYLEKIHSFIKDDIKKYNLSEDSLNSYSVFLKSKLPFLF